MSGDGYLIARANPTARPFCCRAAKAAGKDWIIVARFGTYAGALAALAGMLR